MVEFIIGSSGTGKTTAMFERIKERSELGIPQIILVPEQYSTEFDKKLYFHIGAKAFNELLSMTFSSLSRHLFQIYGEPDRKGEYADDLARLILIYQAVSAAKSNPNQLSFFSRSCNQTGFAEEVLKLINDMKRSGISPQKLMQKAEFLTDRLKDKTSDIAEIYYEYEFLMEKYGFKDNLENIREAAKIANFQNFFSGKTVYFDEFESFTVDQIDMIKVMLSAADDVVITLRTDDVNAGEFTLFETVNSTYKQIAEICREMNIKSRLTKLEKSYRFKSSDLKYLNERAMRNIPDSPETAPEAGNIRIFEAHDMYNEAEYVCAEIKRLIYADKSLKYRDIAIISNNIEDYADVFKAALSRYEIPYFMSIEKPVNHTAVMAFFLSLLDILTAKRFRSEQIFRFMKCGLLDIDITDISILENYCYKWEIDGRMWNEEFTAADDNQEISENLRKQIIIPVIKLKKSLKKDISAEEISRILYEYLVDSMAERNLGILMNRLIKSDRDNDAAELKRLWGCLMDILDSIASTLGGNKIPFSDIAAIMRSMIGRITYSVPPQTLDSVIAASARTARLSTPKIIFVVGASEGDFPNQVNLHGLFSDGDKQKLSIQGIDISRPVTDLIASERLIVYKSLTSASEKLYLTYPLSDLSGQAKYPAQIIEQITSMFSTEILITEDSLSPDFYAVTMPAAYYHYMRDRAECSVGISSIYETIMSDDDYSRRMISALSKKDEVHDYHISTGIMEKLRSFNPLYLSPTAVEDFNRCHFMYFCSSFLKLYVPEKMDLDMRIAGELTHSCFFSILASRSKKEFEQLPYDKLREEIQSAAKKYREEKMAGDFGKTPRFELFFNKLIERLENVFLHMQYSLMAGEFSPDSFELDLHNVIRLNFGNGKSLRFGGVIDRADIWIHGDEKYFRVVDYKSSGKVINEKTLAGGLNLQMLLYLFASAERGSKYEGFIPAGVLYNPIQISDIEAEEAKIPDFNQTEVDSQLRTTGLIIDVRYVLEAMESKLSGRYIPAKINKDGTLRSGSSVISSDRMELLKSFVYESLREAAESMYSGDINADPLIEGKKLPCTYCAYSNICGNRIRKIFHKPDAEKIKKAAKILGREVEK